MRMLSRHMPAASKPKTSLLGKVCCFLFLFAYSAGLLVWVFYHPIISLIIVFSFAVAMQVISCRSKAHLEKVMVDRSGENICTFRRAFNLRKIDPWIVRATHDEIHELVDHPLRASDRWQEDLLIDPDDMDDAAVKIAARVGYDLADCKQNPFYGKIITVGDLVMFFAHQRRIRA